MSQTFQESNWQPIETAPKDEPILVSGGQYGSEETGHEFQAKFDNVAMAEWFDGKFCNCGNYNEYYYPTHWQPLPLPIKKEN